MRLQQHRFDRSSGRKSEKIKPVRGVILEIHDQWQPNKNARYIHYAILDV